MGAASSTSLPSHSSTQHRVHLAVSSLISVPGTNGACWIKDAYHTSIVVDEMEFAFTASGILQQPLDRYDRASHGHQEAVLIDLGASTISGLEMNCLLQPYFEAGTYDMLRKNCNTFSDMALFCLLGHRLEEKYRSLERVGSWIDDWTGLMPLLSGFKYSSNPKARDFRVPEVLRYIEIATRQREHSSPSPLPAILKSRYRVNKKHL